MADPWDYLIVTASNERQAAAYEVQLRLRRELGLLAGVRDVLVVPDTDGRRIGSGGSTVLCLTEVLNRELAAIGADRSDRAAWRDVLSSLRVLIVHGGGDSVRLPAYGVCGKVLTPVPGESDSALGATLVDRQLATYLALPSAGERAGQTVVTAGDDLKDFDPSSLDLAGPGITALASTAAPSHATRHGVFCIEPGGQLRQFLQKPTLDEQASRGAMDRYGQCMLDIAVMSFDAATALSLLEACDVAADRDGRLGWRGPAAEAITGCGLDLYREVCCAMGSETTVEDYIDSVRASGSTWSDAGLRKLFAALSSTPFNVQVVPRCRFLHMGTTRELITSGAELAKDERGVARVAWPLSINNDVTGAGLLAGNDAFVEGCRVRAPVTLGGENVVVGVDIEEPLELPRGACLDVLEGKSREAESVWFVRCYGVNDNFKKTMAEGATFSGQPVAAWLDTVDAKPSDVWQGEEGTGECRMWHARLFPADSQPGSYARWLWMFDPSAASVEQRRAWLVSDRYSLAEMSELADPGAFHERRTRLRSAEARRSMRRLFRGEARFSACDLAQILAHAEDRTAWVADLLAEARWHCGSDGRPAGLASLVFSRIIHTLGSALEQLAGAEPVRLDELLPGLCEVLPQAERTWLETLGLGIDRDVTVADWARGARSAAFKHLEQTIITSGSSRPQAPRSTLRRDAIVWGRAPARLELGGGWTDTPPYTLEHGGCVVNAAVALNGQPPVQAYARMMREPVIRIASIDLGERVEITTLDELMDYRDPSSKYGLAKAALALSGLSPDAGPTLQAILEQFGGGIEITTLAAVPKGSGLGTSSIMGAVVLAAVQQIMGRTLTRRELFHEVLRLEQAVTTGGGWQDQVGGATDGAKISTTEPCLIPSPSIHYVPPDVLDPRLNGGQTLLYYTGITRLAKDILQRFVGRYLDRDRHAMATLAQVRQLAPRIAEAMARRDIAAFGELIGASWHLHKQLNPEASSEEIEDLMTRVQPHVYGARIVGAGSGGFLFMVCRSPEDAGALRTMLESEPPNELGRFFDYQVSDKGLVVTTC